MEMFLVVYLFVIVAVIYLFFHIAIVGKNSVVVCENFVDKKFSRILKEGIHLTYMTELVLQKNWSYINDEYQVVYITGSQLNITGVTINLVPFEAKTKNETNISVHTALTYRVVLPREAMYSLSRNPLSLLCQELTRQIKEQISYYHQLELEQSKSNIIKSVCDNISSEWTQTYGLAVDNYEINKFGSDEEEIDIIRKYKSNVLVSVGRN